jgi:lysozyme family protein
LSKFDTCFEYVLSWEKGFVVSKNDAGGATNWGISERLLKSIGWKFGIGDVDVDVVKNLTREEAKNIYHDQFWNEMFEHIDDIRLLECYFDMIVNCGKYWSTVSLQRACWAAGSERSRSLEDDGIFGGGTLSCVNDSVGLLCSFKSERANYYRRLVASNSSLGCFLHGWLNRTYEFR